MLRPFVTAAIAAIATIGMAQAHSDKPKDAEKKVAAKHASKSDAKKDHGKDKHGGDHGKMERKH